MAVSLATVGAARANPNKQLTKLMTKTLVTTVLAATTALSFAGTTMIAPAPSGKGGPPPKMSEPCPDILTYNEVEVSYVHTDADGPSADGADIRVLYGLAQGVFAYGDAGFLSGDFDNTSLDLGLGAYLAVCKNFHIVGRGGYSYFDADEADSHGWHAAVGGRLQIGCNLELNAKVQYGDLVDFEDGNYWSYGVGGAWHFNDAFALTAEYIFGEDDTWSARGGIRFKF
jgi:hypothetical protein